MHAERVSVHDHSLTCGVRWIRFTEHECCFMSFNCNHVHYLIELGQEVDGRLHWRWGDFFRFDEMWSVIPHLNLCVQCTCRSVGLIGISFHEASLIKDDLFRLPDTRPCLHPLGGFLEVERELIDCPELLLFAFFEEAMNAFNLTLTDERVSGTT